MRIKVGDLVRHIRGNDSIGIVMAVHIFPMIAIGQMLCGAMRTGHIKSVCVT